jgi:predicted permease
MLDDLRFAFRQLAKSPGFAAVVVLSLALGIGANATVLSWIEHLLLRPLPGVARQQNLVILTTSVAGRMWDTVSLADLRDAAAEKAIFAGITGSQQTPACLTVDHHAEWLYGQIVTANFFDVLGVKPLLGRTFLPGEDEKPGGHPVLVISENCWRRTFASDPAILGRIVDLNRHAFTIVGVVPAAFHGDITGLSCDFWAPVMMHREVAYAGIDANEIFKRYSRWLHTYARLQPGVTVGRARAALDTLSAHLEHTYPDTNRDIRLHAWPLWQSTYGAQSIFRPVLGLLLTVSLGVLLIVISNVANLLLARAIARQKEIAIRLAVGASRVRLIRQLLTESLLLAVAGGVGGVLLAYWMVDLFQFFLPRTHLPANVVQSLDGRTLACTLVVTLITGLLVGLVPALQASRPQLTSALKEGGRTSGSAVHQRVRSLLVVVEVALALILLVGASLCLRGLRRSGEIDAGLEPRGVLIGGLRVGMNGYTRDTAPEFYRALLQRTAALAGVESVALADWFPLGFEDCGTANLEIPGRPTHAGEQLNFRLAIVSPGYFKTFRIQLLAGRDFTDLDVDSAPRVTVINETMAQRLWPEQDAVGRMLKVNGHEARIVGVAKAGKYRALNDAPECFFYLPYQQNADQLDLGLCLRVSGGDPAAFVSQLREEIHHLDPGVEIWTTLRMTDYIQAAVLPQQIASGLLTVLGAVALILAAMGVYAVMAYAVSQRTQEFGVRMALGANGRDVLWHVLRQGLLLATCGVAIGLAMALAVTRLLSGFLYGVSPFDPLTFAGIPFLLALVSLIACWVPARRATRVNPIEALRAE